MKRFLLAVSLLYAVPGAGLPVNKLQAESLVEQAAQGLNPELPPPALRPAWTSTFMLFFSTLKRTQVGSAFVVAREDEGDQAHLDLLTADHVLDTFCDQLTCADLMVFDNGVIETKGRSWNLPRPPLPNPNVRVIARNPRDDLALIRITVHASLGAQPVRFAARGITKGARVYALGYPRVYLREDPTGIPEPKTIRRRWSVGEVTGLIDYRQLAGVYVTTSADALPGNSGGPVVNDEGEVVGVLGMTGAYAAASFNYVDSPYAENAGIQGSAIRLSRVRAFLEWAH